MNSISEPSFQLDGISCSVWIGFSGRLFADSPPRWRARPRLSACLFVFLRTQHIASTSAGTSVLPPNSECCQGTLSHKVNHGQAPRKDETHDASILCAGAPLKPKGGRDSVASGERTQSRSLSLGRMAYGLQLAWCAFRRWRGS